MSVCCWIGDTPPFELQHLLADGLRVVVSMNTIATEPTDEFEEDVESDDEEETEGMENNLE